MGFDRSPLVQWSCHLREQMAKLGPSQVSAWQSSQRNQKPAAETFADTEAAGYAVGHLCSKQAEFQAATFAATAASFVQVAAIVTIAAAGVV